MKEKEKPVNLAARLMAKKRWEGVPAQERSAENRRIAQMPRTAKRCFCGETSMVNAANRYFDCCRRNGVITLHLRMERHEEPESTQQNSNI